jgi:hypothetical protein
MLVTDRAQPRPVVGIRAVVPIAVLDEQRASPAPGGFGANNNDPQFSTGGVGGAGTTAAGRGTNAIGGGGGGGGAAGVIRLLGTTHVAGSTISPPPS